MGTHLSCRRVLKDFRVHLSWMFVRRNQEDRSMNFIYHPYIHWPLKSNQPEPYYPREVRRILCRFLSFHFCCWPLSIDSLVLVCVGAMGSHTITIDYWSSMEWQHGDWSGVDHCSMLIPLILGKLPGVQSTVSFSTQYPMISLLGRGLLRNSHVKFRISKQRFSNLASDWMAAQPSTNQMSF